MINFFRKKRKKLADDNKALKYARYAIGEIVLVVIGILIALQLNSWKEERKQIAKTTIYIDNIINDIINDTLNINDLLVIRRDYMKAVDEYFNYFEKGNHTIDEVVDSVTSAVGANLFLYAPVAHTYYDMQSSGNSN